MEQEVDLPSGVKGFMLIRKLKLDANQESMILSATNGQMDFKEVIEKVRAIFPEGKRANRRLDVFEALDQGAEAREVAGQHEPVETLEDVLEVITDPLQNSGDEEEALEIFEAYAEVRRKPQEKKKGRGFQGNRDEASQWKVSRTLRGCLEMPKEKTSVTCANAQGIGNVMFGKSKQECIQQFEQAEGEGGSHVRGHGRRSGDHSGQPR